MVRERGGAPPRRVVSALDATGVGPSDVRPPRGHGNGDGSVTRLPELAKRKQKCIISEEDGEETTTSTYTNSSAAKVLTSKMKQTK